MADPQDPHDRPIRVNPSALDGNPFERRRTWRAVLTGMGSRGWAAAALAIAVLMLAGHLRPRDPVDVESTVAPVGGTHLYAADPRALRMQLVAELREAGVEASGYAQLGINGVDADLPRPVPPQVRRVLERHGIPVPADGVLRVSISESGH